MDTTEESTDGWLQEYIESRTKTLREGRVQPRHPSWVNIEKVDRLMNLAAYVIIYAPNLVRERFMSCPFKGNAKEFVVWTTTLHEFTRINNPLHLITVDNIDILNDLVSDYAYMLNEHNTTPQSKTREIKIL